MYTRYVVGVDGSSPSRAAAQWAAARALSEGSSLVLAHVEEPEAGMMGQDFARAELKDGGEILAGLSAPLMGSGLEVSTVLLSGPVAWALAQFAEPRDVLVIGTHKTGFLHGRVLGSRSVQIAASARSSVAVIPDIDSRFRRGVVVGVDGHDDAVPVALIAASEAHARGEQLSVIRSIGSAAGAPDELLRSPAVLAVRDAFPGLVVNTRESRRGPAEALLDAARDKALLVIGPGTADHAGTVIGTVLHDVLLNVNAPVLVARAMTAYAHSVTQHDSDAR